jgi:hypothetical protein
MTATRAHGKVRANCSPGARPVGAVRPRGAGLPDRSAAGERLDLAALALDVKAVPDGCDAGAAVLFGVTGRSGRTSTSMFAGLTSWCTSPAACAASSADATGEMIAAARADGSGPSRSTSDRPRAFQVPGFTAYAASGQSLGG